MNASEHRREKLAGLVVQHPTIAAFAREHGLDPTYVFQLLNRHRVFGEKAARNMENKMRLPPGWFDDPAPGARKLPSDADLGTFSTEELARIIKTISDELARRAGG